MADYIVRATAAGAAIRAFAITSRDLVETARQDHNTSPITDGSPGTSVVRRCDDGNNVKRGKRIF